MLWVVQIAEYHSFRISEYYSFDIKICILITSYKNVLFCSVRLIKEFNKITAKNNSSYSQNIIVRKLNIKYS